MDSIGARHLAARLRAGVPVGTTIVLERDDSDAGLVAGDRGVVDEITPDGVLVEWERGLPAQDRPRLDTVPRARSGLVYEAGAGGSSCGVPVVCRALSSSP